MRGSGSATKYHCEVVVIVLWQAQFSQVPFPTYFTRSHDLQAKHLEIKSI